jgi:hypothetical protein
MTDNELQFIFLKESPENDFFKMKFPDDFGRMFDKYDVPEQNRTLKTMRRVLKKLAKQDYIKCVIECDRVFTVSYIYTSFALHYPNPGIRRLNSDTK